MFSLLIAIISIALVAVLAVATYYLLGSAFNDAETASKTATLQAQAQQIESAASTYRALTGSSSMTLQTLLDESLLTSIPMEDWESLAGAALVPAVTDEVCLRFNQQRGVSLIPGCADMTYATMTICCTPEGEK